MVSFEDAVSVMAERRLGRGLDRLFFDALDASARPFCRVREHAAGTLLSRYRAELGLAGVSPDELPETPAAPLRRGRVAGTGRAVWLSPDQKTLFFDAPEDASRRLLEGVAGLPGARMDADGFWRVRFVTAEEMARSVEFILAFRYTFDGAIVWRVQDAERRAITLGELSSATNAPEADLVIEGLGRTLRPFQRAGVAFCLGAGRALLGDEPGLGKTGQALATLQARSAFPAVVVCPAALRLNWLRECSLWLPGRKVAIFQPGAPVSKEVAEAEIVVLSFEGLVAGNFAREGVRVFPVVDLLVEALQPLAAIADESHALKNRKALRSEAFRALSGETAVVLLLTGTPVVNRPADLYNQLDLLGHGEAFGGWWKFAKRYCHLKDTGFGQSASGATRTDELHRKLRRTCYLRRTKAAVLEELPAKTRSLVPLEVALAGYQKAETTILDKLAETSDSAEGVALVGGLKKAAALAKLSAVLAWAKEFLEAGEKLVLFAWHREVVEKLAAELNAPLVYGGVSPEVKQAAVDRFQSDPNCRVIVGNLQAMGVGLTLTAASSVAFAEFGWSPAEHDQAEDRCHRIGQRDAVNCYYLAAAGTVDEPLLELIEAKRAVVSAVTDGFAPSAGGSVESELVRRLKQASRRGTRK